MIRRRAENISLSAVLFKSQQQQRQQDCCEVREKQFHMLLIAVASDRTLTLSDADRAENVILAMWGYDWQDKADQGDWTVVPPSTLARSMI
jgi:hypothetical protein